MLEVKEYNNNGYFLAKSVFSNEFCSDLKKYLNTLDSKINIPFSDIPWGYGNLLNKGPFGEVTKNKFISDFCKNVFEDDYVFNHLMVNNKSSWIGSAVEFHQEIFNVDSYAPGYSKDDWKYFMQIYIALDKHTLENGCLVIIPGSDKFGVLPCEDVVGDNLGHKRRVTHEVMESMYKKCGKKIVLMDVGDVLFFNHRVIHGSSSNVSETDRKSIVLQARCDVIKKDDDVFKKETEYRKDYVINELSKKVNSLKNKNMYRDFK